MHKIERLLDSLFHSSLNRLREVATGLVIGVGMGIARGDSASDHCDSSSSDRGNHRIIVPGRSRGASATDSLPVPISSPSVCSPAAMPSAAVNSLTVIYVSIWCAQLVAGVFRSRCIFNASTRSSLNPADRNDTLPFCAPGSRGLRTGIVSTHYWTMIFIT